MIPERVIKDQRVLVTGGAGFIGSNLCEQLLSNDNEVICLDNLLTGKRSNVNLFIDHPRYTFIEGDIRNIDDCRKAVAGCDYVLHQAALGSVPRSIDDPVSTNQMNIDGFLNMLVAAKDEKVKRFVYASSSSVYGDEQRLPKVEAKIGKPLSPYAVTKHVNEEYAGVFGRIYGLETIGLRYFNVFGKRQDPEGAYAAAIPKFIRALVNYEPPVIHGDGTQTRDFTYIDNVVHANNIAAVSTNPVAVNEVYNIAFGESTNLNELIDQLQELLSEFDPKIAEVDVIHGPERIGDVRHSLASTVKAQSLLGYKPPKDLKDGLKEALEWYWNNLK